ncbi:hypothetical protein M9Y10_043474 [Tritrichomonas musculus]|uniref:Amino acid permease family protein n=1 Tax=Tritrichomonas musculus TaxID=1915356 RepID=A0ABR2JZY5_9EUKA
MTEFNKGNKSNMPDIESVYFTTVNENGSQDYLPEAPNTENNDQPTRPVVRYSHKRVKEVRKKIYPKQLGKTHTVGTVMGVLSPCFVNIVNIIYFARLPFVVGTAGGMATLIGFLVSTILVLITVFSLSAMATNGEVESGGSYYLLSRTIGPEIGGSCGICLAVASLIGAAQACLGMLETIVILYSPFTCFKSMIWDVRIFSSIAAIIFAFLANYGFSVRMIVFVAIWIGVIMYFVGLIFPQYTKSKDILHCSRQRFIDNLTPDKGLTIYHFFYTFSIIFPGFGGILAGSNSSGSLKRPQVSIPLGTITALLLGVVIYVATDVTLTACHPRDQLISTWSSPIQDASFLNWFVFAASTCSSVGKAVTGLGAGPMVLRTMGTDGLIPIFFNKYSRTIGCVVAVIFCLWGNFNSISSLSSSLFLCVFAFLNYGLYLAKHAKVLSFRPHFKFYFPEIALIAAFTCVAAMVFINYITAIIAFVLSAIFYYITWNRQLELPWGSLSQSNAYSKGLKAALNLRKVPPNPKLYRPNILLLIEGPPLDHSTTISFLNQMLHQKGLAIVARVYKEDTPLTSVISERKRYFIKISSKKKNKRIHVFYETVVAATFEQALLKMMLLSGLGNMRANVAFIEFDEKLGDETANFIKDVLDRNWSIAILRNPAVIDENGTIDCWYLSDDGGLELLLAHILTGSTKTLRVLTLARVDDGEDVVELRAFVKHILKKYRISAEVVVVPISVTLAPSYHCQVIWRDVTVNAGIRDDESCREKTLYFMRISDAIRAYSSHSVITIVSLPKPLDSVPNYIYMRWLHLLSPIHAPVLFVRGDGTMALGWQL